MTSGGACDLPSLVGRAGDEKTSEKNRVSPVLNGLKIIRWLQLPTAPPGSKGVLHSRNGAAGSDEVDWSAAGGTGLVDQLRSLQENGSWRATAEDETVWPTGGQGCRTSRGQRSIKLCLTKDQTMCVSSMLTVRGFHNNSMIQNFTRINRARSRTGRGESRGGKGAAGHQEGHLAR